MSTTTLFHHTAAAGLAVAALALTACGGGSSTTPTSAGGGGASGEASADRDAALLAYARCMRENGVDMPDPQIDGGRVRMVMPRGGADPATAERAQAACAEHLEAAEALMPDREGQEERALAVARCLREKGYDVPDPDGGGIRITPDSGIEPGDPDFEAAMEECRSQEEAR
ncbi:MAG TPA: hypothetical protein VNZ62_03400 [Capillimicrobium sp.]|nr:hypothetical protein [Capillimicrobium sp.]